MLLRPRRSNAFGPLWRIFDCSRFCGSNRPSSPRLSGALYGVARAVASWKITCRRLARTRQVGLAKPCTVRRAGTWSGSDRCCQRRTWEPSEARAPCPVCWQASWQAANFVAAAEFAFLPSAAPGKRQVDRTLEEGARHKSRLAASLGFRFGVSGPAKWIDKVVENQNDCSWMPRECCMTA